MDQCFPSQSQISQEQNDPRNTDLSFYSKDSENDSTKLDNDCYHTDNSKKTSFFEACAEQGNLSPFHHIQENANEDFIKCTENVFSEDHVCSAHGKSFLLTPDDKFVIKNVNIRRHSVGGEDFLKDAVSYDISSNHDKRFQTLSHSSNFSVRSSNSRPIHGSSVLSVSKSNLEGNKGSEFRYNENQSKVLNTSSMCDTKFSDGLNGIPLNIEKIKDKSFKRKSSLNRLDFIHFATPSLKKENSQQHNIHSKLEYSSSDDHGIFKNPPCSNLPVSSVKRKSQLPLVSNKSSLEMKDEGTTKNNPSKENNLKTNLPDFWKVHHSSSKLKNSKIPCLQKKSYSAGEQELLSDHNENISCVHHCLSAQEVDEKGKHLQYRCKKMKNKSISFRDFDVPLRPMPKCIKDNENIKQSPLTSSDLMPTNIILASASCDITSQTYKTTTESCDINNYRSEVLRNCNVVHRTEVEMVIGRDSLRDDEEINAQTEGESTATSDVRGSFQKIHFDENVSSVVDESENLLSSYPGEISIQNESFSNTAYQDNQDSLDPVNDLVHLTISSNCSDHSIQSAAVPLDVRNNCDDEYLVSEKEVSKHPTSILKKGYQDEKKELHGILKYTGDDKLAKQRPSILKHRESSEEKDNIQPSDLHSILKKSTSEDESTNSSNPDIRPILKNASTDDESYACSVRPKPILKKRTSFNDEFSYACFLSSELKPILKKKTIPEFSEEQPKPILKTRRKSEEAGSTAAKIVAGTRPRANSADLNVKTILKK